MFGHRSRGFVGVALGVSTEPLGGAWWGRSRAGLWDPVPLTLHNHTGCLFSFSSGRLVTHSWCAQSHECILYLPYHILWLKVLRMLGVTGDDLFSTSICHCCSRTQVSQGPWGVKQEIPSANIWWLRPVTELVSLKLLAESHSYSCGGLESEVSSQLLWGVLEVSMSRFPSKMYESNEGKGVRCSHTALSEQRRTWNVFYNLTEFLYWSGEGGDKLSSHNALGSGRVRGRCLLCRIWSSLICQQFV